MNMAEYGKVRMVGGGGEANDLGDMSKGNCRRGEKWRHKVEKSTLEEGRIWLRLKKSRECKRGEKGRR